MAYKPKTLTVVELKPEIQANIDLTLEALARVEKEYSRCTEPEYTGTISMRVFQTEEQRIRYETHLEDIAKERGVKVRYSSHDADKFDDLFYKEVHHSKF